MCTLWSQEGNDHLSIRNINYGNKYRYIQHQEFLEIAFNWAKQLSLKRNLTFLKLMMEVNLEEHFLTNMI